MEEENLTRREKRVLAKERKKEERKKEEVASKSRKWIAILIILAIVGFLGWKFHNFITQPAPAVVAEPIGVFDSDHIEGNKEAKTTLIEYGDFQCPACQNYYPLVKQLVGDLGDNARIVFRNYPLTQIHPNALPAAKAAEAAATQGKYWEMHDMLFEKHDEWAESSDATERFIEYAISLGLDTNKFKDDMASKEVSDKISADIASGDKLYVNATPTFFLEGTKIQPTNYDNFKSLVQVEIDKNK